MSREDLEQAVFDLYYWQYGGGTNFRSDLYSLFCKAASDNLRKLAVAFPLEYAAWLEWRTSMSEKTFFRSYGIQQAAALPDDDHPTHTEGEL
jgi:hypothetical protein